MVYYFQTITGADEISIKVEKITVHPNFRPEPRSDYLNITLTGLAIIRLKEPIPDSPSTGVACLPLNARETFVNDEMLVMGWGKNSPPKPTDRLKYGTVRAMKNENCNILYEPYRKKIQRNKTLIGDDVMCTLRGFDDLAACVRDLGGNDYVTRLFFSVIRAIILVKLLA